MSGAALHSTGIIGSSAKVATNDANRFDMIFPTPMDRAMARIVQQSTAPTTPAIALHATKAIPSPAEMIDRLLCGDFFIWPEVGRAFVC
jgi:hypothetical protein